MTREMSPQDELPRQQFRRALVLGFFFKFYNQVQQFLQVKSLAYQTVGTVFRLKTQLCKSKNMASVETYTFLCIQNSTESSLGLTPEKECRGSQVFEQVPEDQVENDAVWRPVPHVAADQHATGQAVYIDDIPKFEGSTSVIRTKNHKESLQVRVSPSLNSFAGELFLAFVKSTEAHAEIESIDTAEALAMPGVHGVVTHRDFLKNQLDMYILLAEDKVLFFLHTCSVEQVVRHSHRGSQLSLHENIICFWWCSLVLGMTLQGG